MRPDNEVLRTIQERRSAAGFCETPVPKDHLKAVLEAGRWAPSYLNSQPWHFIVVTDQGLRKQMAEVVRETTVIWRGVAEAPVVIAVVTDAEQDALHYVEDGAVAAQNMALAARSIGLASYWVGIHRPNRPRWSAEKQLKKMLHIPKSLHVIAVLPLGYAGRERKALRKDLDAVVFSDYFGRRGLPR